MSPGLEPGSTLLTNDDEILLRQVHPKQFVDGVLSKVAFYPSEADEGLLSTRRGHIDPKAACEEWLLQHQSAGTWGVAVGEFRTNEVPSFDDSHGHEQPQGHASADFTAHSKGRRVQIGRKLRELASARGALYLNADVDVTQPGPGTSSPA